MDQELNGLSLVSRDSKFFLKLLSISFHYEDGWNSDFSSKPSRKCFLSAIVPFCGGGTLCERLFKGLSSCAGDHMQSVVSLPVSDTAQKFQLAREIVDALCHCHSLGIVHSDLCCCNILLTCDKEAASPRSCWSVKVANAGVFPDSDSFEKRRVYLAPEVLMSLAQRGKISTPSADRSSPLSASSSLLSFQSPPSHYGISGASPLHHPIFSKESDVYALGITLLQLFRHTLLDCKEAICAVASDNSHAGGLKVPLFSSELSSPTSPSSQDAQPPHPPLPAPLQDVISSCTRRNPKERPSAAEIRYADTFSCCKFRSSFSFCNFCFLILFPARNCSIATGTGRPRMLSNGSCSSSHARGPSSPVFT